MGGNNEKTNKEVVDMICELLDKKFKKSNSFKDLIKFVKDRPGHDQRYAIDANKIKENLDGNQNIILKKV